LNLPPGAHVSLWSVIEPADPETRPGVPYPMLMQLAIYGSERKSLTLQGIYEAIATRFRYFRREDILVQSSVRHALSLYSVFVKVPRPKTVPGKGCSWVLNIAATKQYGRLRKRNTANRKNEKKNNAESERGSRNKVSDAQTRRPSNRSKATTRIARGVYEDTSDSTSVSDSLYPSFGQGAYVSDSDTMSDATSISPFDESNLQPAFHEGAHLSFPSSVSSLTTEVSSNDYATRVSNGLRSRSGASRRAQEPVSSSKRGRRTCVSD
ncbi:fork head domain-containing protein, partial [Mycena capillaripes]